MNTSFSHRWIIAAAVCILLQGGVTAKAALAPDDSEALLDELVLPATSLLEDLVAQSTPRSSSQAFASYYAERFVGRRTTSGHRYNPKKLTAAHHSLPIGTVVRVVNSRTGQEVHVTVNDRCAPKRFPFIDLSRAAAQKIGLLGRGKMKVVIIPLLDGRQEEPA